MKKNANFTARVLFRVGRKLPWVTLLVVFINKNSRKQKKQTVENKSLENFKTFLKKIQITVISVVNRSCPGAVSHIERNHIILNNSEGHRK